MHLLQIFAPGRQTLNNFPSCIRYKLNFFFLSLQFTHFRYVGASSRRGLSTSSLLLHDMSQKEKSRNSEPGSFMSSYAFRGLLNEGARPLRFLKFKLTFKLQPGERRGGNPGEGEG